MSPNLEAFLNSYGPILLVATCLGLVIWLYFSLNSQNHSKKFMMARFWSWFPLGMSYAFLYMARYNLSVSKNALGNLMPKESFGIIFGVGTFVYGLSFLLNGPLVDKWGSKKGMIVATVGASMANILMGVVTYLFLNGRLNTNLTVTFSIFYGLNMFFQSYGAVSIIKNKAYWFHVRERGTFGAIFGTLISFGVYFAFDWGGAIAEASKLAFKGTPSPLQQWVRSAFAIDTGTTDATWLVFFIPAAILLFWALIDYLIVHDSPVHAKFDAYDPHDASSGIAEEKEFTMKELLVKIFTNPVLLTVALVEFTSGVIRNGILQWYFVFAHEVPQAGAEMFGAHWGLLTCILGIVGGFAGGYGSDRFFGSRRGPPAAILNGIMIGLTITMALTLFSNPFIVGVCAVFIVAAVVGVHSLMSGTAAADFGGRKASATSSGIVDGCVYLGSGLQSVCIGFLAPKSWTYWPIFLIPFTILGCYFAYRIWHQIPEATKSYLAKNPISKGSGAKMSTVDLR